MNAPSRLIARPDWPRLMSEPDAAAYLSISPSTLRQRGPAPKPLGSRRLWDRRDLDRWCDALDGQPLTAVEQAEESSQVERRFIEERARRRGAGANAGDQD